MSKPTKKDAVVKKIPFVLKENYIQVTLPSGPFALQGSHPTFKALKKALKEKDWKKVPKLVSVAENIANVSHGNVTVKGDKVYYKEHEAHTSIATRILSMINEGKDVLHLLKFMNNLYLNPAPEAITEFYGWLENNDLPITDTGCFLAYKSVNDGLFDTHTGKIFNGPGQQIMMPRKLADANWRTQCSSGFHICSKHYGLYGTRTMAVVANPKDVLSAEGAKIRVTKYEVLRELGNKNDQSFRLEGYAQLEKKLVIELGKERKEMIKMLLASKDVQRAYKKKKIVKTKYAKTLLKTSMARLTAMVQRFKLVPPAIGPKDNLYLSSARKAAGLTQGQLAEKMGWKLTGVVKLEQLPEPDQSDVDKYLAAIADLVGIRDLKRSAITYPKPVKAIAELVQQEE